VPLADLNLLERIEDRIDLDDVRKAHSESIKKSERAISGEEARKRLGL
jgi:hypothetical protein